jgi:hypothetical protein
VASDDDTPKRPSDSDGPLTPVRSSATYPVWRKAARELADALEGIEGSVEALVRHAQALEFLRTFESWKPGKVDDATRTKTITAMLTFNNETRAFILRQRGVGPDGRSTSTRR